MNVHHHARILTNGSAASCRCPSSVAWLAWPTGYLQCQVPRNFPRDPNAQPIQWNALTAEMDVHPFEMASWHLWVKAPGPAAQGWLVRAVQLVLS